MITSLIILFIILNIPLSHIVAKTSEKKDIGYNTTFWVSFLFSPLIGLLLSIASPNNPDKVPTRWYRNSSENDINSEDNPQNTNIDKRDNQSKTRDDRAVGVILCSIVVIFILYVLLNQ